MNMTKEEQLKLHDALSKIAEFIDVNIIPQLCGTQVTVDFGEVQTYCSAPYREKEFHLTVTPRGCSLRTGGLGGLALVPTDGCFKVYEIKVGMALLKEWPQVKYELVEHVNSIKKAKSLLDTFEV